MKKFIIVGVAILVLGAGGLIIYKKTKITNTKKVADNQNSSQQQPAAQSTSKKSEGGKTTVTFNNATINFELPKDWKVTEDVGGPKSDEKLTYVIDPTDKLQLEIQILAKSRTSAGGTKNQTPEASFVGIHGKEYYMNGYKGISKIPNGYEVFVISACGDMHCYTQINKDYDLNLAIRSTDLKTPVTVDNPIIGDIQNIIKTIQF